HAIGLAFLEPDCGVTQQATRQRPPQISFREPPSVTETDDDCSARAIVRVENELHRANRIGVKAELAALAEAHIERAIDMRFRPAARVAGLAPHNERIGWKGEVCVVRRIRDGLGPGYGGRWAAPANGGCSQFLVIGEELHALTPDRLQDHAVAPRWRGG